MMKVPSICIACETSDRFVSGFMDRFSALPVTIRLVSRKTLDTETCSSILRIFAESEYLIVFLNPHDSDNTCIRYAVQSFDEAKKKNKIIPIFVRRLSDPPAAYSMSLVKRFGNRLVETADHSQDEIVTGVCARLRGLSKLILHAENTVKHTCEVPTFYVRNSIVRIMTGSILDSKCDVAVSSDDNLLTHGGGISKLFFEKGGPAIQTDAVKNIPADLGGIVVTTAGELSQKLIFHAVTITLTENCAEGIPASDQEIDIQEYIVSNAVRRSFYLLSSLQLTSIAFPVIGTGHAKIPFEKAVTSMLSIFAEQLQKTARPLQVELWLYHPNGTDVASIAEKILTGGSAKDCGNGLRLNDESENLVCNTFDDSRREMQNSDFSGNSEGKEPGIDNAVPMKIMQETAQAKAPENPLQGIFISYSRKDLKKAKEITAFLKEKGFRFWIDMQGTYSGSKYKSVIVQAIRRSRVLLFLSSENSNLSDNVIKEISLAVAMKKAIIPVKIDHAHYSDDIEYDLCPVDYIDLTDSPEEQLRKLHSSLLSKLKR